MMMQPGTLVAVAVYRSKNKTHEDYLSYYREYQRQYRTIKKEAEENDYSRVGEWSPEDELPDKDVKPIKRPKYNRSKLTRRILAAQKKHVVDNRKRQALVLREAGLSISQIGKAMGRCKSRADQLIWEARRLPDG